MTQRETEISNMPFKYFYNCDAEVAYTVEQMYDEYLEFKEDDETFDEFCDYVTAMGSGGIGFCTMEELKKFVDDEEIEWADR